jgi:hypothetical protein
VLRLEAPRDAEVEHLHLPVDADHHVFGLDIAVNQALAVRRGERLGHVDEPADPLRERGLAVADVAAQRPSFDELEGDEGHALDLAGVVDRHGAGVVERGRGLRLAHQPLLALAALDRGLGLGAEEHLERDAAPEHGVVRAVHEPHPALAEHALDDVAAQSSPDHRAPVGRGAHRIGAGRHGSGC